MVSCFGAKPVRWTSSNDFDIARNTSQKPHVDNKSVKRRIIVFVRSIEFLVAIFSVVIGDEKDGVKMSFCLSLAGVDMF